jgi:cyclopropane-fatty-acyl-phospholipid synthase
VIPRALLSAGIELAERGRVPDLVLRRAIRSLCASWARSFDGLGEDEARRLREEFVAEASAAPVAPVPELANEQHYEVPAEFFELCLGARRKYSSCWWGDGVRTLDEAEEASLALTCEHAGLADGQRILELGCGWGSLSLWMAERYPASRILAVSNSASQRRSILARAESRGLTNLRVVTADVNGLELPDRYDRVVSVEMFEHMRNWRELLRRISGWLEPDGRLFLHFFCHRAHPSVYGTEGPENWMGRHFFTGGIMPSRDLLEAHPEHLAVESDWWWDGTHYRDTSNAWLANLDAHRDEARAILATTYGARDADRWLNRWRLFFLSCAELFGLRGGAEWGVGHYRLAIASPSRATPSRISASASSANPRMKPASGGGTSQKGRSG